jgi:hypothetical protein
MSDPIPSNVEVQAQIRRTVLEVLKNIAEHPTSHDRISAAAALLATPLVQTVILGVHKQLGDT